MTDLRSPAIDTPSSLSRLRVAADHYREAFGWETEASGQTVVATLGGALGAVAVAATRIRDVLARIATMGEPCPTLVIPRSTTPSWVVLVDTRDYLPDGVVPGGLQVLPMFTRLPLPPSTLDAGVVRWLVELDYQKRWLPSVASVLLAGAWNAGHERRGGRPTRSRPITAGANRGGTGG